MTIEAAIANFQSITESAKTAEIVYTPEYSEAERIAVRSSRPVLQAYPNRHRSDPDLKA